MNLWATYTFVVDGKEISIVAEDAESAERKLRELNDMEHVSNRYALYHRTEHSHQESPNENHFEEMNDYLDGTMNV